MSNEVMKKDTGSIALFGDDAAKGFENMTQEDMALPFGRIQGQISQQATQGDAKYIAGAKHGMLYDTINPEVYTYNKGIEIIRSQYINIQKHWS